MRQIDIEICIGFVKKTECVSLATQSDIERHIDRASERNTVGN